MKYLITLLLTIRLVHAQTNYPPNTAPWSTNPTNWVYDCNFLGYNTGTTLGTTNYPCGWYDEPVLTNSFVHLSLTNSLPFGTLQLQLFGLGFVPGYYGGYRGSTWYPPYYEVSLQVENCVFGSNYNCYASENAQGPYTLQGSFTAANYTNIVTFPVGWLDHGFFRVSGPVLTTNEVNSLHVSNYVSQIDTVILDPSVQNAFNSGLTWSAGVVATLLGFSILRLNARSNREEI